MSDTLRADANAAWARAWRIYPEVNVEDGKAMGVYIADAFQSSIRGSVDAPNVPRNQDDLVMALDTLLSGLKRARNLDPNHTPFINDYSIASVGASNTEAEIQGGTFTLAVDVQTGSAMERIFLSINFGETVTVTAQL